MSPILKRVYDRCPVSLQNALLSAEGWRLNRQRYGGRFSEFRELLESSQWWTPERMRAWQEERLGAILRHAYKYVPYYHQLFRRCGYDPFRFNGLDDLARIPVLTRDVVKHRTKDLMSREPGQVRPVPGHTSGTTGSPATLFYDAEMIAMNYAAMDRQYRWAGARLEAHGDRVAVLRGNSIVPLSQQQPPFWRLNRSLNQLILSSFHLSPSNLDAYCSALRDYQPSVVDGYPSSLYVLARMLLARGERLEVRAAITSSETLYAFQRDAIESAFNCRVFDYYAAAERVVFSVECDRHSGHHLCEEYGITEILDEDGEPVDHGSEGFLIGTTLHNRAMPLIRYRTGDKSTLKTTTCSCGRTLPLAEDVTTKVEDLLRLRDGRLIPPSVLTHPFKPLVSIEGSQIVQKSLDHVVVRIIASPTFGSSDVDHLKRELRARLGDDMHIDIEQVTELPRTERGKFRWVISQVQSDL